MSIKIKISSKTSPSEAVVKRQSERKHSLPFTKSVAEMKSIQHTEIGRE